MQSLKRPLLAFAICLIFGLMGTLKAEAPAAPAKGKIKLKAVWERHRFSQKTNKQICFVCCEKLKCKQKNLFIHFLGDSMARQSAFGFIWPLACHIWSTQKVQNFVFSTKFDTKEKPTLTLSLVFRVYRFEFFIDTAEMFLRALGSNINPSLNF